MPSFDFHVSMIEDLSFKKGHPYAVVFRRRPIPTETPAIGTILFN